MSTIAVLVAKCKNGRVSSADLAEGRSTHNDPLSALVEALLNRGANKAVLIRPSFNETDKEGSFHREWRSFNDESFKEYRWYTHDSNGDSLLEEPPVITTVADTEIVIPNIPDYDFLPEEDPMPDSSAGERGYPRCFEGAPV